MPVAEADLVAVLRGGKIADTMPETRRVVEDYLERVVAERVDAVLAGLRG